MKISLVQSDLVWENKSANFRKFEDLIAPVLKETDIIILPEMFNTGFTMNVARMSEPMYAETFQWMKEVAEKGDLGICGSYIVKEGGKYFNRFVFVSPGNDFFCYDKRHLFSMGGEDNFFSAGESVTVFDFRGARISPYICYDLRFPVWSRNQNKYDIALYVAAWPEERINVWNTLLNARAIENQCYVAGCNRTGTDGNEIEYNGLSQIIDPKGEVIESAGTVKECTVTAEISVPNLLDFRKKFNVLKDADEFSIDK
jgi:predicted amidohydrolase